MLPTYFIVAWFALPVFVWGAMLWARRRVHPLWIGILCSATLIAGIVLLANYVWALDAQLLSEIDKYEPGTPEADRASEEWASDTDRSFLLLLSPVLTAVYYTSLLLVLWGLQRVVRRLFPARDASPQVGMDSAVSGAREADGNPYQSPTGL